MDNLNFKKETPIVMLSVGQFQDLISAAIGKVESNKPEKMILCIDEVCELTGYAKATIYRATSRREIPFFKPASGKLFFKREEVLTWLAGNRQGTTSEFVLRKENDMRR